MEKLRFSFKQTKTMCVIFLSRLPFRASQLKFAVSDENQGFSKFFKLSLKGYFQVIIVQC